MTNNKQTAVEWLVERYNNPLLKDNFISKAEFEQAKAMEKEQIIDAYGDGLNAFRTDFCNRDEYYNETYGGNK
jgi:hypothetical protein